MATILGKVKSLQVGNCVYLFGEPQKLNQGSTETWYWFSFSAPVVSELHLDESLLQAGAGDVKAETGGEKEGE